MLLGPLELDLEVPRRHGDAFASPCLFRPALLLCPASQPAWSGPVQGPETASKCQSRNSLLRTVLTGRAIFVRDAEPVPFEHMPVSCKHSPPQCGLVYPRQRAILRPSDHHMGLDVIRPYAYTHTLGIHKWCKGGLGGRHNTREAPGAWFVRDWTNTAQTWIIV